MINTCPGCMWIGAPTSDSTVLECTTFHCRVERYYVKNPSLVA